MGACVTTYTIKILNESGFLKSYIVFLEAPVVTCASGPHPVTPAAWATFPDMQPEAFGTTEYDDAAPSFAYWGKTIEKDSVISASGVIEIDLAAGDEVAFTASSQPGFGAPVPGMAAPGSFRILTTSDFTAADDFILGVAHQSGLPIPTAMFVAEPNDNFEITPVVRFYVSEGVCVPGQMIDMGSLPSEMALVDFTGMAETQATAIQAANGAWTVEYS